MMSWRPELSAISDIATNIFAVFILVLVIMLDLSRGPLTATPPPAAAERIEATQDLVAIERSPVRPEEMVEMLRSRTADDALIIDLFENRIEIAAAGRPPLLLDARRDGAGAMLARTEAFLRGRPPAMPARLYVFSNRWY